MSFYVPLDQIASDYERWATSAHPRIPTGFAQIDALIQGGVGLGEVCMIQARSGVGKTAIACNIVCSNLGRPTVFVSLEMAARRILERLAAIHTDTPTDTISVDLVSTGKSIPLDDTVQAYGGSLAIVDRPAMSIKDMGTALQEVYDALEAKPEIVVIDFLELVGGVAAFSASEKIDALTYRVKDFARRNDVAVFLLHQVGRGAGPQKQNNDGSQPLDITSSRYGGEISADYLLGAYRPCLAAGISQDMYQASLPQLRLQLLKTRGGHMLAPEGLLYYINPRSMRISEWDFASQAEWLYGEGVA